MSMPRCFPSIRGWIALLVPLLGGLLFLALIPDRFIESGVGKWLGGRVSLLGWLSGGLLILLSVGACVEAFRRGSAADRVFACIAALLTFLLIEQYLELFLLPVRRPPNMSLHWTGSSRFSLFQWGGHWRLLPASELGR